MTTAMPLAAYDYRFCPPCHPAGTETTSPNQLWPPRQPEARGRPRWPKPVNSRIRILARRAIRQDTCRPICAAWSRLRPPRRPHVSRRLPHTVGGRCGRCRFAAVRYRFAAREVADPYVDVGSALTGPCGGLACVASAGGGAACSSPDDGDDGLLAFVSRADPDRQLAALRWRSILPPA